MPNREGFGSGSGVESLLAQLGCEERDNKLQERVAEQLLAAQQAISVCHDNVLHLLARKLEAMRHVEIENQLLFERIAVLGGPSSSSSSYVQAGKLAEGLAPATPPPATRDPPPPPKEALTTIVPDGESCGILPGSLDTVLDTVDEDSDDPEEQGSIIKRDREGSIQSLKIVPIAKMAAPAAQIKQDSNGPVSLHMPPAPSEDGVWGSLHSDGPDMALLPPARNSRKSNASHVSGVSWAPLPSNLTEPDEEDKEVRRSEPAPPEANNMVSSVSQQTAQARGMGQKAFVRTISDKVVAPMPTDDYNTYRRTLTDWTSHGRLSHHSVVQRSNSMSARLKGVEGKFEVLTEWEVENEANYRAKIGTLCRKATKDNRDLIRKATMMQPSKTDDVSERAFYFKIRKLVIHPCGVKRAMWDMMSLMLVTYDMAVLPLQFFDPEKTIFTTVMEWYTRTFWTVDMPISLSTGFLQSDGSVMMRPGVVAKRYLLTWFGLDLILVALDWLEVLMQSSASSTASDYGRLGKMGRTFRILRMVRLLRLVRMREILKLMTFRMQSEKMVILADIAKILVIIMATAHLMACFWYGIADETNPQHSWIGDQMVHRMALEHKYLISMHWAVSQFSGGMDEFRANSFEERFYNVTVFLAAFMMAAVCVSGLTSSMTRLHILSSHQSRQLSTLRRYLIQNGISDRLALRVQRNALHAISEQQRLMAEKHVELLGAVSEPLRVELHFEMYSPVLEVHPFFNRYIQECPQVMMRVCHQAMSTLLVSCGDIIFNDGEIPDQPKFYIVCNGQMEYIPNSGAVTKVQAEEWLSEGALWTHWMHRGVLKAKSDGRLCIMDAKKFLQIVCQFDHPEFDPRAYAIEYVKNLNDLQEDKVTITDLKMEDQEELIDMFDLDMKAAGTTNFGAQLLSQFTAANKSMMDTPRRRESVLFVPSKTAKMKRNSKVQLR